MCVCFTPVVRVTFARYETLWVGWQTRRDAAVVREWKPDGRYLPPWNFCPWPQVRHCLSVHLNVRYWSGQSSESVSHCFVHFVVDLLLNFGNHSAIKVDRFWNFSQRCGWGLFSVRHAASVGNWLKMFRGNVVVSSSRVDMFKKVFILFGHLDPWRWGYAVVSKRRNPNIHWHSVEHNLQI